LSLLDEAKRVINCGGRVFAAKEDPDVKRIWMAEGDCPGLAMSRAFGDFCLKEYGLSSVPDVSYRKLTKQDEFVVLASDGVSIQILLNVFVSYKVFLKLLYGCVHTQRIWFICDHIIRHISGH